MFVKMAYVVRPNAEFLNSLHSEIADYLAEPRLILREDEPHISGNVTEGEWIEERTTEIKLLFVHHLLHDLINPNDQLHDAVRTLHRNSEDDITWFDRWWIIERIEDVVSYESLQLEKGGSN